LLNKIRQKLDPLVTTIGSKFASTRLSPNVWTGIATLFALSSAYFYATFVSLPTIAGVLLLLSGFFDIVDGSVARVAKKVSKVGAFLDSTLDRLAEVAIFLGILLGNYVGNLSFLVLLALGLSLMVSYERARAESLGTTLTGIGIGERAERVLVLAIFSIAGFVLIGVIVVLFLVTVTVVHRFFSATSQLSKLRVE
jgi:archaetidylinositol phosphate synthase